MVNIWRTQFTWTGWAGSPGYTSLYGNANIGTLQGFVNDAWGFMNDVASYLVPGGSYPAIVRISQAAAVQTIDDATGNIQSQTGVTPGTDITGSGTTSFAATTGSCITWYSNTFIDGRRLRGRTFFVPLSGDAFAPDGTLSSNYLTVVQNAVTQYLGKASEPVIWHRPRSSADADGSSALISTGVMADKAAVLRSRRD